jgi:extradiol dioxygenase family protein
MYELLRDALIELLFGRTGQPGEQWTMFFKDPSGNSLEFKAMTHPQNLFAKYYVE